MNRTVLYIAISLDGFVAGPNDDISWLFRYNDVDYGFNEFFSGIGAIIQGTRAYEIEVKHGWETPTPVPTFVLSHHLSEDERQRFVTPNNALQRMGQQTLRRSQVRRCASRTQMPIKEETKLLARKLTEAGAKKDMSMLEMTKHISCILKLERGR